MKAKTPKNIPVSIDKAKHGLAIMSSNIVFPAGTDLYKEFARNKPIDNNIGIPTISQRDHLPSLVFGAKINLTNFYL